MTAPSPDAPGQGEAVIICAPRGDCADPNVNRWYCMRGHADEDKPPELGICPLVKCDRRGANR